MRILISVLLLLAVTAVSRAEQNKLSDATPVAAPVVPSAVPAEEASAVTPAPVTSAPVSSVPGKTKTKQSVTFQSLAQMDELIELGVPALALSLLEAEQNKREQFTADWYVFEYKRILLLSALEQWHQIVERTEWLFETVKHEGRITRKIRLWFETQQVIARLQLKQSEQALGQLQTLLWTTKANNRDPSLPEAWRRLVIRSYLQMHRHDDARRALVKYNRDYETDKDNIDWMLLQAQVLLKTNRPEQAAQLLKQITLDNAVDVEALILVAQLQSDPATAEMTNTQMREQLDGQILSRPARWAYSYVAYLASVILKDLPAQVLNLEAMLSLGMDYPVFDGSSQVSADDLWQLYNTRGMIIANKNGLLFGNDEQWQALSNQLIKKQAEQALALNAALVLHTDNFATKQQQHKTIVEILEQRNNGLELINQLYLHSNKVKNVEVLPDEVRYRLVDYALSEGDYYEAATIMKSLKEPPQGKSLFDWRMRKARVLILQGEYNQSENLIRKTFSEQISITSDELDRFIQVVFDFQTVQQHQQAINLFSLISYDSLSEKLKRELYFWKAESYFSLKEYDRAALFYLESSRAVANAEHDLWGQSARFKAAQSLVLAEIYTDAEKVYKDLLLITVSDSRKALINQNLQKIRLLKSTLKK